MKIEGQSALDTELSPIRDITTIVQRRWERSLRAKMTKVEVHMHGYLCVVYYALCIHFGRDINFIWGIFTAHANMCVVLIWWKRLLLEKGISIR